MTLKLDVFKLEKPMDFRALLGQIELISYEINKWTEEFRIINRTARINIELISGDNTKDAFHNISQNIIDLSKLIQKKIQEV